jgi:hypothetical protein
LLLDPDAERPPGSLTASVTEADRWPGVGLAAPMLCHPGTGEAQAALKPFVTWPRLFERRTPARPPVRGFLEGLHAIPRRAEIVLVFHGGRLATISFTDIGTLEAFAAALRHVRNGGQRNPVRCPVRPSDSRLFPYPNYVPRISGCRLVTWGNRAV